MHLLLIEDDLDLGASLQQALRGAGFSSEWLRTAADARRFAMAGGHHCILLDLACPTATAWTCCASGGAGAKAPRGQGVQAATVCRRAAQKVQPSGP